MSVLQGHRNKADSLVLDSPTEKGDYYKTNLHFSAFKVN